MYDRPAGTSPIDPYYAGGISRAPPNPNDSYSNYDSYQKYYSDRPRDPDYPTATNFNGSSRFVHKRLVFIDRSFLFLPVTMILIQIIIRIRMQCLLIRLPFVMMFPRPINKANQDIEPHDNNQATVMVLLIRLHMLNIMVLNNEPNQRISGHCQSNKKNLFLADCLSVSSLNSLFFFGV